LKIERLELGLFKVNCYILSLEKANIIIDPGADFIIIRKYLESKKIKPDFILNTHGHYDHIGAVKDIISYYGIPFYIHEFEEPIITDPDKNISSFFGGSGLSLENYNLIKNNDYSYFNDLGVSIANTPGHTPGSIIILVDDCIFTGDLLFKGSIGRTDLPGGSIKQIKESLAGIRKMNKKSVIYPGHGPASSLKYELENNYYLQNDFLNDWD
jgi:hydroxyacylglutathione hydrolase